MSKHDFPSELSRNLPGCLPVDSESKQKQWRLDTSHINLSRECIRAVQEDLRRTTYILAYPVCSSQSRANNYTHTHISKNTIWQQLPNTLIRAALGVFDMFRISLKLYWPLKDNRADFAKNVMGNHDYTSGNHVPSPLL